MENGSYHKVLRSEAGYHLVNNETKSEYEYNNIFDTMLKKYFSRDFMKRLHQLEIRNNVPVSMVLVNNGKYTHYKFNGVKNIQNYGGFIKGVIHRDDDLPAIYDEEKAILEWYKDGKPHRDNDLPAVEASKIISFFPVRLNKTCQLWYHNGKLHREDGPASIEHSSYTVYTWYKHGEIHRTNGPAIYSYLGNQLVDRNQKWYVNNKRVNADQWIKDNNFPSWQNWEEEHEILFTLQFS